MNFRFVPQIFGGVILLSMSKITTPNGSCAQGAAGMVSKISAGTCSYALPCAHDWLLQPVLLDSTTVSCCCTFSPTFASPWRNSFVQIHGATPLLKAKFGTTPQKRPKNDLNWGVGSSYCTNKSLLPNPPFSYEIVVLATKFESPYQNWELGEGIPHQDLVRGSRVVGVLLEPRLAL